MTSYNSSDFFNLAAFTIPPSRNFTYAFVSGSSYTILQEDQNEHAKFLEHLIT